MPVERVSPGGALALVRDQGFAYVDVGSVPESKERLGRGDPGWAQKGPTTSREAAPGRSREELGEEPR